LIVVLAIDLQGTVGVRIRAPPPQDRVHVGDFGVDRIRADIPIAVAIALVIEHHAGFNGQVALRVAF
jgi:hypothetical protein